MYLGTVTGRVVATVKDEALESRTLLLVRRRHDGKTIVAVDSVGAGDGESVYVCRGREASFAFKPDPVPSDATVVGIVDAVEVIGDAAADIVEDLDVPGLDAVDDIAGAPGNVEDAIDEAGTDEDR